MNKIITRICFAATVSITCFLLAACSPEETKPTSNSSDSYTITDVAEKLGVTEEDLKSALGDPSLGPPDFDATAVILGISAEDLESAMKGLMNREESVEVPPYSITLNGIDFEITYNVFDWSELPSDVNYERLGVKSFTDPNGNSHRYEAIYVSSGNLNWYQAAYLAEKSGGYLACPTSEEENTFVFSLVDDYKFFWAFEEDGPHYGISIGPFLGGYQPEGSQEPAGGWSWLSGENWDYQNWAVNLDDGIIDKDPRINTQPNDSGDGQPIMGFGEMNTPVPTWGDYMVTVGTYGLRKSPGSSYGFIIEYEN